MTHDPHDSENTNANAALGNPDFAALVPKGVLFSNYQALSHPSQPNYIGMIAGDTFSIGDDRFYSLPDATHKTATTTIVDLLEAKGITWRVYAENLGSTCNNAQTVGSKCAYARKHNPFMTFSSIQANYSRCKNIVDASRFQADVSAGSLPQYIFYLPNLCNDGHDTGVGAAGKFLSSWVKTYMSQTNVTANGTTVLQLVFDENDTKTPGNAVFALAIPFTQGAKKKTKLVPGSKVSSPYNHYSILRGIEDNWKLGTLGRNDATASPLPY